MIRADGGHLGALISWIWVAVATTTVTGPAWAQRGGFEDDSSVPVPLQFVQGLRERGYYDVALDYLEDLRDRQEVDEEIRQAVDLEIGRTLIDEADRTSDLLRGRELLGRARARLETFRQDYPEHPQADEARIELARLLYQQARLTQRRGEVQREDRDQPERAEALFNEARGLFVQAGQAYEEALAKLDSELNQFPLFLERRDPRYNQRRQTQNQRIKVRLQRALVTFDLARSYPEDEPQRTELLEEAREAFATIAREHRTTTDGIAALMYQGRCYEELGQAREANGLYQQILDNNDPSLIKIQRQTAYFQMLLEERRGNVPLAADKADIWLQRYPELRNTALGLMVQLVKARTILAQLPQIRTPTEQRRALRLALDLLNQVVRAASPARAEALALLREYRPEAAETASELDALTYETAMSEAEIALNAEDWSRAILLLETALARLDLENLDDLAPLHRTRFQLALAYSQNGQPYRAAVLAEHLARRYPEAGLAARASELAYSAYVSAYNTFQQVDRASDLNKVIEMAQYTAETWPDSSQALNAQILLGSIATGQGRYEQAIATLDEVSEESEQIDRVRVQRGLARLSYARELQREGEGAARRVGPILERSIADLQTAYTNYRQGRMFPDSELIEAGVGLAEALLESGEGPRALEAITPLADQALAETSGGDSSRRVLVTLLRAQIASEQVEEAIATLKQLESAGLEQDRLVLLYYSLGRLLEAELDRLKEAGEGGAYVRTRSAYQRFLTTIAEADAVASYDLLQWAGESLLTIDQPGPANRLLKTILKRFGDDAELQETNKILRTQLKLVESQRKLGRLDEAQQSLTQLIEENANLLDPRMELGRVIEERARKGQLGWREAFSFWRDLTSQLGRIQPRPDAYYEAWYHVAIALRQLDRDAAARQALTNVMRQNPKLGSGRMKSQYQRFLQGQ